MRRGVTTNPVGVLVGPFQAQFQSIGSGDKLKRKYKNLARLLPAHPGDPDTDSHKLKKRISHHSAIHLLYIGHSQRLEHRHECANTMLLLPSQMPDNAALLPHHRFHSCRSTPGIRDPTRRAQRPEVRVTDSASQVRTPSKYFPRLLPHNQND